LTKSFGASKNSEVAATYSFLWIGMRAKSSGCKKWNEKRINLNIGHIFLYAKIKITLIQRKEILGQFELQSRGI
jgi:hypothetical protein